MLHRLQFRKTRIEWFEKRHDSAYRRRVCVVLCFCLFLRARITCLFLFLFLFLFVWIIGLEKKKKEKQVFEFWFLFSFFFLHYVVVVFTHVCCFFTFHCVSRFLHVKNQDNRCTTNKAIIIDRTEHIPTCQCLQVIVLANWYNCPHPLWVTRQFPVRHRRAMQL